MFEWDLKTELNKYNTLRPISQQDKPYDYDPNTEIASTPSVIDNISTDIISETLDSGKPLPETTVENNEYVELINNHKKFFGDTLNKCWKNSTIQILYYLRDFRDIILNLENTDDTLKKNLEKIKEYEKYDTKDNWKGKLKENITLWDKDLQREKIDGSLMIPALFSIMKEMNMLDNNPKTQEELEKSFTERGITMETDEFDKYKKVYMGLKEHFIFAQAPNVENNTLFGNPESIFINLGLKTNMNHSETYKKSIIELFNYKQFEVVDFYNSKLEPIYTKYNNKKKKQFNIK